MHDPEDLQTRRLVSRLRFRDLQLLVMLRDGGSLRAAASRLNLTQPALSKTLREVELAFGFALFARNARGLTPTPRGEVAVRGAALLLQELAHLGAEAAAEPAGTIVRIGAPPFVAQGVLPAMFVRLLAGDAPVRVQLQEERVPLLINALLAGRLDALVSSYPMELPEAAGRALRYDKLFDAAFTVIAPPDHPLGRARRVPWQRLGAERWIMPAGSSMVRRMMDDAFRREGVAPPTPVIES
ncbi:MAG: LysR family transcriptional regulator, partial [Gammaproteobacteria bacterium]|nr:LysR family transcriptional regulator [Gammaproteobacteria bacterium]